MGEENGIDEERWNFICELKNVKRGRLSEYAEKFSSAKYTPNSKPWTIDCKADVAMPCATQNEIDESDAKALVAAGVFAVVEGANMPSTPEAIEVYKKNKILYGPAKAANAGGVAVSGLEMSQNSLRLSWTREEVDEPAKDYVGHFCGVCERRQGVRREPDRLHVGRQHLGLSQGGRGNARPGRGLGFGLKEFEIRRR